ncbi:MAG: D-alanine--D-alanine ligase [Clostridiales bacterium]|nr:D-alanine--D-alanine ligase [Clostridiales bacterium]
MKKILILFGGVSTEYDVSLISAGNIINNISKEKYDVLTLGITRDGKWYLYSGTTEKIMNNEWINDRENLVPAIVSPDRSVHGITVCGEKTENIRVDAVFPVLHGKNGEDGTVQGLLELAGIPFVGCDMISSAMSMNKAVTNTIADHAKVAQAKWLKTTRHDYLKNGEKFRNECEEKLGFPLFVKPANAGSSVGISKVGSKNNLDDAVRKALGVDDIIVVEEGIDGSEVECAVLGNDDIMAPTVGEIVPCNDFYDYDAKYLADKSELHIPARLPDEKIDEVRREACKIFRALGCSGFSRVDFFVRRSDGKVLFNEINTIPGFTPISMYPKMFDYAGIKYPELIDRLISLAIEKKTESDNGLIK